MRSAPAAIPGTVIWAYAAGGLVVALGLLTLHRRGTWRERRGLERLLLLGPLFYAAPLAGFGTEHFTLTATIASLIPRWIPWHHLWAYLVGACFIGAALSIVTGVRARLAAGLVGATFFLFVVLMDAPAWLQNPGSRFALALALRELAFSGGALALAAGLREPGGERGARALATVARYFIAVAVLFYSVEQLLHGNYVPGIPLNRVTPGWVYGRVLWTYAAGVAYAVTGTLLLLGRWPRAAATWLGVTVLCVEAVVYVPIAVVDRASVAGFNYLADTLMFAGAALLLARAMPEGSVAEASPAPGQLRERSHERA